MAKEKHSQSQTDEAIQKVFTALLSPSRIGLYEKLIPRMAGFGAQALVRTVIARLRDNGDLVIGKDIDSILFCVADLAALGLVPDFGQAYLIPYGKKVYVQVGPRGWVNLAMRSGKLIDVRVKANYWIDTWDEQDGMGDDRGFRHVPAYDQRKTLNLQDMSFEKFIEALRLIYAVAMFKDGYEKLETLESWELQLMRQQSKAMNSLAWGKFGPETARSKCLYRMCKHLPFNILGADIAAGHTNALDAGESYTSPIVEENLDTLRERKESMQDTELKQMMRDRVESQKALEHTPTEKADFKVTEKEAVPVETKNDGQLFSEEEGVWG